MRLKPLLRLVSVGLLAVPGSAAEGRSGWRAGLDAGYGFGGSEAGVALGGEWNGETPALRDDVSNGWSTNLDPSGAAVGVHGGYDHRFDSGLVLGGEVGYARLGIDDERGSGLRPAPSDPSVSYDFGNRIEADDLLLFSARIGYAWQRHLVHLVGGWASVDAEGSARVVSSGGYRKSGSGSDRLDGVAIGLGYSFAVTPAWSVGIEYRHLDLGSLEFATGYEPGSAFVSPAYSERFSQDLDLDLVRLAIDHHF